MLMSQFISSNYPERVWVFKWVAFLLEVISACALLFLMALTCTDVIGRYFFSNSLDAASELTEIALAILIFAEMPIITWRGGHIIVDVLDSYLGSRIVQVLGLISIFVISSGLYILAVKIFALAERSLRRSEVTEYLGMPIGYIVQYIAIMSWITAFCAITYGLFDLFKSATDHSLKRRD